MEIEEINKLSKQVYMGESANYLFGSLGVLIGQRSMIARQILDNDERNYKNPDEHRRLMYDAYNHIENQIKDLLLLNKNI